VRTEPQAKTGLGGKNKKPSLRLTKKKALEAGNISRTAKERMEKKRKV